MIIRLFTSSASSHLHERRGEEVEREEEGKEKEERGKEDRREEREGEKRERGMEEEMNKYYLTYMAVVQ